VTLGVMVGRSGGGIDAGSVVGMPDPLRVNAVELLRQPGAVRDVDVTLDPSDIDVAHERLTGPVTASIRLVALNDGIEASGTVSAPWSTVCRRCLTEIEGVAVAEFEELHRPVREGEIEDPEVVPIEGGQLDLTPAVRETILLELDTERLCRDDCAGLCPVCGADRNEVDCGCDTTVRDERWAALDDLVVDD
jgi:uncharacterized protein